ncbi:uncharacterized protein LOC117604564 [Osmia lignaria lignaria]|uniref:uncharacterized protein LOC117604564 n=1 Tax=Osmia lignaria lignaria TaxID=1437193 RepID=UPI00402B2EA0
MSISTEEGTLYNQEEIMNSASRVQEMSKYFNRNHEEEDKRIQSGNKKSTSQRLTSKVPSLKDQMEASIKLLQFVADTQLSLTQINGQRKLGPPIGWTGPPPGPKCEVFVGSIPRNYYEPEIVFIFSSVGKIYELRLMMDFSGANRGYCFIMYTTEEEAARAIKELDQYEIYPGKRIGVVASINNCRLYINQMPRIIDTKIIVKRIYEITDDVDKVAVYRNLNGFVSYVLVSYKTHRGAAMGRRRLVPESMTLFKNHEINIEWANPNVTPSNVFEECGTYDEHGNIQITETFIEPVKVKKVVAQTKRSTEKRNNSTNNHHTQNSFDASVRRGRPIKAAKENSSKNSINQHTVQKCTSKHSVESTKNQRKMKNIDINGNLKNTLDQSLLYKTLRKNDTQQHNQSHEILPLISTYLNKEKYLNRSKLNNIRESFENTFRTLENTQNCARNFPHLTRDFFNYKIDVPCQCRFYVDFNSSKSHSVDSLTPKFSENNVENYNNYEHRNVYNNEQQIPINNDTNNINNVSGVFSLQATNNHQLVDTFQYPNYYQNFQLSNDRNAILQNVQRSTLNNDHFLHGVKAGQNPEWSFSGSLPHEAYAYELQKIIQLSNGISNNYPIINSQQMQDSFVNEPRFDKNFSYSYPVIYQ